MAAPLAGSLYDGFSPKGQRALAELRAAFRDAGFYAEKERWTERTLRVYPERRAKYPLLNPGFVASRQGRPVRVEHASIVCPIYSDGDEAITRLLRAMPGIEGCHFSPITRRIGRYHLHGTLVLPLSFVGSPRKQLVDFTRIHPQLSKLYMHLSSLGFSVPQGAVVTVNTACPSFLIC
jgi:hypothetical protein